MTEWQESGSKAAVKRDLALQVQSVDWISAFFF